MALRVLLQSRIVSAAPQSSPGSGLLPAFLLALCLLVPGLSAQERATVRAEGSFHRDPDGTLLGTLVPGASVTRGAARNGWVEVTVDAWIWTVSTERTTRDGFDLAVTASPGENLRTGPDGPLIGRAVTGALFNRVGGRGGWTHVRRTVWVRQPVLDAPARREVAPPPAPPPAVPPARDSVRPPATDTTARPAPSPGIARRAEGGERVALQPGTQLHTAPSGPVIGEVRGGSEGAVTERNGDWVRVSMDAWVRRVDVSGFDLGETAPLTLTELRADPDKYTGRRVTWRLQFLALQTADELRPEMPLGQPYLLTRGPLPESGFVYLMIPRDEVTRFRGLQPLAELVVEATIRASRTRYLPNPVLELVRVRSGG